MKKSKKIRTCRSAPEPCFFSKAKKIPMLLSPVRDQTCFRAAMQAGAKAVYFGIGELNMRLSSKGISLDELPGIMRLACKHKIKVFITLNVIVYEHELEKVEKILKRLKKEKINGIICWDMAVIKKCKKLKIPFHVSTQASVSNSCSVKFWENLGAKCIVLARECTLEQIKEIKKKAKCKIEVFCHGAMCVSVSGRCFLSQFLHCKSANRGECMQPCRHEYTIKGKRYKYDLKISNGYVMSPRDLCTLGILQELVETGVDILKIEGRGRSAEYVYAVTRAYKQALEAIAQNKYNSKLKEKLIKQVARVYNRKFSNGFLFGRPGDEAWAGTSHNQAREKKEFLGKVTNYFKKIKIAEVRLNSGDIKKGDVLQIQGNKTGIVKIKIYKIKKHPKGEITFPCKKLVRPRDQVYKIVKN